jgi:hypothetical protein
MIGYYDRLKAREVAIVLSQNLISFHKGRRASARTPINMSPCLLTFDTGLASENRSSSAIKTFRWSLCLYVAFITSKLKNSKYYVIRKTSELKQKTWQLVYFLPKEKIAYFHPKENYLYICGIFLYDRVKGKHHVQCYNF